ncbi:hypothetical protein HN51_001865 [Arachis hypogaea]|uniref:U-box domain-containing protein 19-like n=1 Tax=Arachis hypogaea TaxID=3818 RepID=UPI000DECB0AD|nr:U-box domain-containing protein 19-like [Arachis hypogaea]QHO49987.1 U-box domain-containing protein [Arachis hypogaea]
MNHNNSNNLIHQRDRRVLSLPAVHPCEGISPNTLISSLVTLSQNICNYQHSFFATQRRNAREAIRQVSIILFFLLEIQERSLPIPQSTVLSLSELHFTFQKIHFLLQDCVLQGARLLLLAKSNHVASLFQSLVRAVATSLDVLPLHEIEVSGEVRELVELLAKQARKAKMEHEPKDEHMSKSVHSILKQLEKGIEVDKNALKEIIEYLEIKTWNECNREINLLEEEVALECSNCNEREHERDAPLLSSLLGLMSYCRVVIFETLEISNNREKSETRMSTEMMTSVNPEDFRCPISLEMMTDPVTVTTGQTYDRASIKKWLKAGNTICPKTGENLSNTELVPNTTLKRLIQQFCNDNGISLSKSTNRNRDLANTILPGSAANAHAMQFVSWFLTRMLAFGTDKQKSKAAYEIRLLARSNLFNRACLIQLGTIPPLLDLLLCTDEKSTQENAISALMKLSKHATGPQHIMDSNGLKPILTVLKKGLSLEARQVAAATVFYLSSVREYRKVVGENPEVVPSLVELVNEGTTCGKRNAVVAIYGLVLVPRNQKRAIEAGVVHALVGVLGSSEKDELVTECLAVLAVLAENVEGANAILRASALSLITAMLQTASLRVGKEHCASILLSLCVNIGAEVVAVLAKDPSVMPLLYSLLTEGTSHAAKKARFLIKVLQDFSETRASGFKGSSVPQEPSLPVW